MKCLCGCSLEAKRGNRFINGHNRFVQDPQGSVESKELAKQNRLKTLKSKYGVENCSQIPEVKIKKVKLLRDNGTYERTGERARIDPPLKHVETKEKLRMTCLGRYGTECVLGNKDIHKKTIDAQRRNGVFERTSKRMVEHNIRDDCCFNISPNNPESKLIYVIDKYGLPFQFTGNTPFKVGNHYPDFVSTNHIDVVVEVLGTYWHTEKRGMTRTEEEDRMKNDYGKHNYNCCILWEDEMDNEEEVLKKLTSFL